MDSSEGQVTGSVAMDAREKPRQSFVARLRAVSLLFASLGLVPMAAAEIYKWTDENGVVRYSDRPPVESSYREISQDLPNLYGMDSQPLPAFDGAGKQRQGKTSKPRSASSQRTATARQQQCEGYRQSLGQIQRQLREGYSAAQGNRIRERRRVLTERQYRQCRNL